MTHYGGGVDTDKIRHIHTESTIKKRLEMAKSRRARK
jgi:hypothetical protein